MTYVFYYLYKYKRTFQMQLSSVSCMQQHTRPRQRVQNIRNGQTKPQDGVREKKGYLIELFSRDKRPGEEKNCNLYIQSIILVFLKGLCHHDKCWVDGRGRSSLEMSQSTWAMLVTTGPLSLCLCPVYSPGEESLWSSFMREANW